MSFIGNIIWLIFGGFFAGIGYILGGLLLCLTIIGIPFGMQCINIGIATLAPFGKEVKPARESTGFIALIFDAIWILTAGWALATVHLTHALVLAVTIVGIPFALQHVKLVPVSLFPFHYHLN